MTAIHKLRVILDTEEDIFRDIDILADQTLLQLHEAILGAFGIADGEMASYYHTDEEWAQGEEIPMVDMGNNPDAAAMHQIHVEDLLVRSGDRLLYVYDYLNMWTFFIEFVQTLDPTEGTTYPTVSLSYGDAPKEAPSKDFGETTGSKNSGLFGGAFDEEEGEDEYDGDLHEGEGMWD
ncbi:IS1096 element passenger TnpR family protein [Phaeocystidibacter luteus]|uniref:Plasmid pRiA4b ORF-3 family protein n=1 Tax=Phaeocystidibacter luteus TaxID=911197 RepID=A0A6N6RMV0_9FLAO|nr:hypothetical protein [Phaeocystidibacter luteus]KAB2814886.1 plasmid pRiA4b ORF-3 family protein [Phaeocystidibacter luteus]